MPENANRLHHLRQHVIASGQPAPPRVERTDGPSAYQRMVEQVTADRTGCARWLDRERRWCNRTDDLVPYQVGPLCPEHQPASGGGGRA